MNIKSDNIFLIGGGIIRNGDTATLDKYFISQLKKNPTIVFFPTASGDLDIYIKSFVGIYTKYGCNVLVVELLKNTYTKSSLRDIIFRSDAIYIGGGNAIKLINTLTNYNLQDIFKEYISINKKILGLSAGASILNNFFLNYKRDLDGFTDFELIKGLGFVPTTFIAHFEENTIKKAEVNKLLEDKSLILGVGDCNLAKYQDKKLKIIKDKNTSSTSKYGLYNKQFTCINELKIKYELI